MMESLNLRIVMSALSLMLLCASSSARAQDLAAAEAAVPAVPRQDLSRQAPSQPAPARALLAASAPAARQTSLAPEMMEGGPAVPNVPRAATPDSVAAPPSNSPDASHIN